jgi:hypothetical protein
MCTQYFDSWRVYRPAQAQATHDVRQNFVASILQGQLTNAQILGALLCLGVCANK